MKHTVFLLASVLNVFSTASMAAPSLKGSLQLIFDTERPRSVRESREFIHQGILRNNSNSAISAPISIVLTGTTPGNTTLKLLNPDGETAEGFGYKVLLSEGELTPGQETTINLSLVFANPFSRSAAKSLETLAGRAFKNKFTPKPLADFSYSFDLIRLPTGNRIPLAMARAEWSEGLVLLDGSESSDTNTDQTLSYQWSFVEKPNGSLATLLEPNQAKTSFTPDLQGLYSVALQVNDGYEDSLASTVSLTITPEGGNVNNRMPLISSTPNTGATGTKPYTYPVLAVDPDGDELTYQLITKPIGMSIDENGVITWTPSQPHHDGMKSRVELEVRDGKGGVATQSFEITIKLCTCL
jgi:hypothetical protein